MTKNEAILLKTWDSAGHQFTGFQGGGHTGGARCVGGGSRSLGGGGLVGVGGGLIIGSCIDLMGL